MQFRTSCAVALALASSVATAADDLDGPSAKAKKSKAPDIVREIEKGPYVKVNVGSALYLGKFAGFVSPGSSEGLGFGVDFIDQEKTSAAFEASLFQGVHNGCGFEEQIQAICPGKEGQVGPLVQGDLRTYTFSGALEWSYYPARRFGIGLRAGGGMLSAPLLMEPSAYQDDVVAKSWGGQDPGYHGAMHMTALGGPTIEYYTKLSHFSIGVDVDVFYAIGFDMGANATGALKYTF